MADSKFNAPPCPPSPPSPAGPVPLVELPPCPPAPAEFPRIRQRVRRRVPREVQIPPPEPPQDPLPPSVGVLRPEAPSPAEFCSMMQSVRVIVAFVDAKIAPPDPPAAVGAPTVGAVPSVPAWLFRKRTSIRVNDPKDAICRMAPPLPARRSASSGSKLMPLPARQFSMMELVTVRSPEERIAPPPEEAGACPFARVRPSMLRVAGLVVSKIRTKLLPEMARTL